MVAILRPRRAKGPPPRRLPPAHFNAPLHSLGAFAVATAIVVSGASASVAGVMAYLDIRNVSPPTPPHTPLTGHRPQSLLLACARGYHTPCPS